MFKLLRNETGAAFIYIAFFMIFLMATVGLAIDYSRYHILKSELVSALDSAAISGSHKMGTTEFEDEIQKYFDVNYPPSHLGSNTTQVVVEVIEPDIKFKVSVTAQLDTTLLKLVGQDTMQVYAETEVTRDSGGMEIVLALDNTTSMSTGGKFNALKLAANDLVDILFGDQENPANLYMGLVPFASSVNIGNDKSSWLSGYHPGHFWPTSWGGCVTERHNVFTPTENPHDVDGKWGAYRYPFAGWPFYNIGCTTRLTPLTNSKSTIESRLNAMNLQQGGTVIPAGLAWAWRVISPSHRGYWGSESQNFLPLDYNTPAMSKAIVLLTDGQNQMLYYSQYRSIFEAVLGSFNFYHMAQQTNTITTNLCESVKASGVLIFAVTFQVTDTNTKTMMENCASQPAYYFDSPSNAELRNSFKQIGNILSSLRISK